MAHGTGRAGVVAGLMALVLAAPAPGAAGRPLEPAQGDGGGVIAFASTRGGDDAEIFLMDADGTDLRQITDNHVHDHSPDWAPDGRHVVFVHETGRANDDLRIVDTVTGAETVFTSWRYWLENDPVWSPDGKWIAFASRHPDGDGGDVIALSLDGQRSRVIAVQQENSTNVDPAWSPDGKRLAFIEYYDSHDIHTASFCCSHGRKRTLTRDSMTEFHPEWSPDGTKILFSRSVEGVIKKNGLYTIGAEGGPPSVVFEGPLDARSGTWSPDGETIAFYARAGVLDYDIYRINADGTGLTRLTDGSGSDQHPDWSPL